jgi:hypothetical protein
MKLEDMVCSFEQAETFQKLGAPRNSLYGYRWDGKLVKTESFLAKSVVLSGTLRPAYTVAELGILLGDWQLERRNNNECRISNFDRQIAYPDIIITFSTEAQSKAEALIWLIDNGYVNPGELKL